MLRRGPFPTAGAIGRQDYKRHADTCQLSTRDGRDWAGPRIGRRCAAGGKGPVEHGDPSRRTGRSSTLARPGSIASKSGGTGLSPERLGPVLAGQTLRHSRARPGACDPSGTGGLPEARGPNRTATTLAIFDVTCRLIAARWCFAACMPDLPEAARGVSRATQVGSRTAEFRITPRPRPGSKKTRCVPGRERRKGGEVCRCASLVQGPEALRCHGDNQEGGRRRVSGNREARWRPRGSNARETRMGSLVGQSPACPPGDQAQRLAEARNSRGLIRWRTRLR